MKRRYTNGLLAVIFILAAAAALPVQAAIYGGYSQYYIPGHEEQMYGIFSSLGTYQGAAVASGPGMHSVISVTASEDNTTVYYDHWEDGYEFDPDNPDSTSDVTYVLSKGQVLSLVGLNIPCAPRGTATFFDGGDRLYSAGTTITVSRSSWPEDSGPVLAIAWELLPVKPFLTDYTIPVGNNLTSYEDFSRTYVLVQSVADNNVVQINDPTTPGVDVVVTLDEGGYTQLHNISAGTTVKGQLPVQVHFIVGRDTGVFNAYEARGYNAVPDSLWDNEYMSPVGSQGNSADVDIYLYNPHDSAILIDWADTSGSGSFSIPGLSTLSYRDGAGHYVPQNSGAYVRSDSIFWGIASSDTESRTYDWGFSLIPINFLTDEYFLSWAPGTSDPTPTTNGSPAFVAAIYEDTTVFVDYSPNDDVVDAQFTLDRLQSQRIFDPDNDNTGMHIWATGPLAVAWGQDADAADTGNPFLDLGTSNLPMPKQWVDLTLAIEKTASPSVLPPISGSETTFRLEIDSYDYPVYDITVVDLMPPGFTFKIDSTKITFPGGNQKNGTVANPTLALNPAGQQILTWDNTVLNGLDMAANQKLIVTFEAVTDGTVTVNTYTNKAQAIASRLGGSQVFSPFDNTPIYVTALTIDKDTGTPSIAAGGIASYTIRLQNISNLPATGVSITDSLASTDFTYAAANPATISFYDSSDTLISSSTDTNDGSWGGAWTLAAGDYVVVEFAVATASSTRPASYDSNAAASFTWNGTTDSIDDKGRVAQDSGTPDGEDPEPDENVLISSLLINKSTSTPQVSAGGTATYRIYMENFGNGPVTGVDITDALPGGFNFASASITLVSASQQAGWSGPASAATLLHWGPWTINSGGSITIDFTVNIPTNGAPLTYDNTVVADSDQTGQIDDAGTVGHWLNDDSGTGIIADAHTPSADTESDEDVTISTAVLLIDMDSISKYTISGGNASYQIKVLNGGTANATNTVVDATLPTGFSNNTQATIKRYNASDTELNSAAVTRGGTAGSPTWNVPWDIAPGEYVIVEFDTTVNTAFIGIVQSDAGAVSTQTTRITDIGNVGYDNGTIPLADPEPDENVQILTIPACDLQVLKSHGGNFTAGGPNSFTIDVTNNGPSIETAQITISDTLPVGLVFDSYSGGNWNCSTASQTVTCTNADDILVNASLTPLTINVTVNTATATLSVDNSATVSSPTNDHIPTNDTSTDTVSILMPDLDASVKTVLDMNGGDAQPGDLLRYTIKLVEGNGLNANGVQVTDNIPNYVTGFSAAGVVLKDSSGTVLVEPADYDNSNSTDTGGANGTGFLDIRNLTIPANDYITITFEVSVAATAAQGSAIANTALVINPDGPDESPAAPTLTVQASQIPATGEKPLYLYRDQTLSRIPPLPPQEYVIAAEYNSVTWTMTPISAGQLILDSTNGSIPVTLNVRKENAWPSRHDMAVTLAYNGPSNGTIGTANINDYILDDTVQTLTFNVPIGSNITLNTGTAITMSFRQNDNTWWAADAVWVYPIATVGGQEISSRVNLDVDTVINVDSVSFYDAAYPNGAALTNLVPGTTVYVRALVSDPFGSFDITAARITIVDPEGSLFVNDALMQQIDSTDATKTYEYPFTVPDAGPAGFWTASVTAVEGTENTVSHTGVGAIEVTPLTGADLQVIKSHVGSFFKNSNGTFTLNVTNFGPEVQTAPVVVRDTIPTGLSYVSSSGSGWTVNTSALPNVVWTYPASTGSPITAGTSLPPISLTVKVETTAADTIQNTATVDPGIGSNNPTNNSSTDTVYIVAQDVVKLVDVSNPYYDSDRTGNIMTYTMTVSNNGAGPMDNVTVSDPLPAGTTYVANSTTVSVPPQPVIRATEYYIANTAPGFTGLTYNLTLNQNLAANYFVIIQGSDGDGDRRDPDQNYVALTGDPAGTGDLAASGAPNVLGFTRHANANGWRGVITVVESLRDNSGSGFLLRDVARVAHNNALTNGTDAFANGWTDLNRVMLLGGFNGAGCDTTAGDRKDHNSCHARLWPSGTATVNWSRNSGGRTLQTATSTVMAIEWGSAWTVQRVRVQGTNGGDGADAAGEYNTAAIAGVLRGNTWVWGTGHTDENGIGNSGEGVLITLGNDFNIADPPNTVETQVAVGIEYAQDLDFEVYALTHSNLAVDYRFKADGNQNDTTYTQTVDGATVNRMALVTNGSNGTNTSYPRSIWSARYTANNSVQLERRFSGETWPAWIQGINFSGIIADISASGGAPPNLVTAADGYSLQPDQFMTVTFQAAITNAGLPQAITNTVSVTSAQSTAPATAAVVTEVRTLGIPTFTDATGAPVSGSPSYTLDGDGGPVYVQVVDKDRNKNANAIESITVWVTNPLNGDRIQLTLYETGINTGIFANDSSGNRLVVPLFPCQDPSLNCCSTEPAGCDDGEGGTITMPGAADSLWIEPDTTPNLQIDYVDPADPTRDTSLANATVAVTQVVLSDFGAYRIGAENIVFWETASEIGTAAFNLLRRDSASGDYVQVNQRPLRSLRRSPQGGIYRFKDPAMDSAAEVTYLLQEIETGGEKRFYGPYTIVVGDEPDKVALLEDMTQDYQRDAHPPNGLPEAAAPITQFSMPMAAMAAPQLLEPGSGDSIKITVSSEGFYYLSAVHIASLLETMDETAATGAIATGDLALSHAGTPVPYLPATDNSGLYFYGIGFESVATDSNTYWLRPGSGLLMESADTLGDVTGSGGVDLADVISALQVLNNVGSSSVRPDYATAGVDVNGNSRVDLAEALYGLQVTGGALQPAADLQIFTASLHLEKDLFAIMNNPQVTDPAADYWFWNALYAFGPEKEIVVLSDVGDVNDRELFDDSLGRTFTLEGWSGQGLLDLHLELVGEYSELQPHHVIVTINGTKVGETSWAGEVPHSFEINSIDPAAVGFVNDGTDFFTLQAVLDDPDGYGYNDLYFDSISITYQRAMQAPANSLAVRADSNSVITVDGFSANNIRVLDVANPYGSRLITDTLVDGSAGDFRVSFSPSSPTAPYFAVIPNPATVPDSVTAVIDSPLLSSSNSYDYLVIAPTAFIAAAQRLVDYRTTRGHNARVVDFQELVDNFNSGVPGPEAVREFLRFAHQNWQTPPRYVVLAGDGTYDYKDIEGVGDNQIPALLTGTPSGLFPSDQLLADVVGDDGMPDLAIGRLPASSAAELNDMIDRIIVFESYGGAWQEKALLVAEAADSPGPENNFKADSQKVAALMPQRLELTTVFEDDGGTAADVIGALNNGTLIMNYIGHGGYDRLASNGLLTINDIGSLTNDLQRPLIGALTCVIGNFARPGFDYLGEALVKAANGGAIAVWSPSGLSFNDFAVTLDEEFARQLSGHVGREVLLGDLILASLQHYQQNSGDTMLVKLTNLLGDPALIMPLTNLASWAL